MERDYKGNLRILAAIGHGGVFETDLRALREKYNLSDQEYSELFKYCEANKIRIIPADYIEDDEQIKNRYLKRPVNSVWLSYAEVDYLQSLRFVWDLIIRFAENRVNRKPNQHVDELSHYNRRVYKSIEYRLMNEFTKRQLSFIVKHFHGDYDGEGFSLSGTDDEQEECECFNVKLNAMIPTLEARELRDFEIVE